MAPAFIGGIGATELAIICVVLMLFIAPRQLPKVIGSLGESITKFKRGIRDEQKEISDVVGDVRSSVRDVDNSIREAVSEDDETKDAPAPDRPRGR